MQEYNNTQTSSTSYMMLIVFAIILSLVIGLIIGNYMSKKQVNQLSSDLETLKGQLSNQIGEGLNFTLSDSNDKGKLASNQRDIDYLNNRIEELNNKINETITFYQKNWRPKSSGGGGSTIIPIQPPIY